MGFLKNIFGTNKVRDKASQLGIVVTEVTRDLPAFDRANHFESLNPGRCTRYALPKKSHSGIIWEMLQRDEGQGAQLPNGYLVKSQNISQKLLDMLRPIAQENSEEYFECEGTANDVAVFWEEWGGAVGAERIHSILLSLQNME